MSKLNKKLYDLQKHSDKEWDKTIAKFEKEIAKQYLESLSRLKNEIALMYEKYGDSVKLADMIAYKRMKILESKIAGIVKELSKSEINITSEAIKESFKSSYELSSFAYSEAIKEIGVDINFGKLQQNSINASVVNPFDLVGWDNRIKESKAIYLRQIRDEITQGLIKGSGYSKIAKEITSRSSASYSRVLRVVRTEAGRSRSSAQVLAQSEAKKHLDKLGLTSVKVWVSAIDNRTRDTHKSMDGQKVGIDQEFTLPGGYKTSAPRLSGIAKEDINCRCTTIIEIEGL